MAKDVLILDVPMQFGDVADDRYRLEGRLYTAGGRPLLCLTLHKKGDDPKEEHGHWACPLDAASRFLDMVADAVRKTRAEYVG